jgi:hypothetical protein
MFLNTRKFSFKLRLNPKQTTSVVDTSSVRSQSSVDEFIDPCLGDEVNSRYDNPMPELTLSPSQGSMNSATGLPRMIWKPGGLCTRLKNREIYFTARFQNHER